MPGKMLHTISILFKKPLLKKKKNLLVAKTIIPLASEVKEMLDRIQENFLFKKI